ncbi:protein shisa-5-like isoform X2 [Poecilia formosa]|uniref:protein shisa-5-like isoform X2 n=1 Tax=Poecilia formosa TaxID=48698 RepID=UPI00044454D1|nr:PREDICTED: protein shisa-5-like isoform X2 [Poecilia formosa]
MESIATSTVVTSTVATSTSVEVAIIIGEVIAIIICVCLICFVAPCCLFYKLCRKPRNQRQTVVNTAANMPQPHYSPSGYQAQPPDYQGVAVDEGSTVPNTPPPSYMESTSPSYPAPFVPGPPNQPSTPPLPSDEIELDPYNPIYTTTLI